MEASVYNAQGKKTGTITLPDAVFGVQWNESLMHQVVTAMQANARTPVAHVKTRGEVRGGGKKPWRQKGTGRARHGSTRSPIWRSGGVTHGPRNDKVYAKSLPSKMRAKALYMALSRKMKDGEVIFVDRLSFDVPKTAVAKKALSSLAGAGFGKLMTKRKNAALVALASPSDAARKSFRNIGNVLCADVRNLNPVSVLGHAYVVVENPEASIAMLQNRVTKKSAHA